MQKSKFFMSIISALLITSASTKILANEPSTIYCPDPTTTSTGGQLQFVSSQIMSNAENLLWQGSNEMHAHNDIAAASPWYEYYQTPYVAVSVNATPAGNSATVLTCQYSIAYGSGPYDYQNNAGYVKATVPGVYNRNFGRAVKVRGAFGSTLLFCQPNNILLMGKEKRRWRIIVSQRILAIGFKFKVIIACIATLVPLALLVKLH